MNKKRRRLLMGILADYLPLVRGDENRAKIFVAATEELNKLTAEEKDYQKKWKAPKEGQ